ncbi:hypothetical protein M0R45_031252 [Rubus argutus]|uniref:J domain-containing protein n=1 Tax=Rubus argutus TaxID=59490 RepID=A0AAW1WG06_RUBAR
MAQLLSPVFTEALKFQNPLPPNGCSRSPWRIFPDATPAQIKKAYYNCMKACHPDLSGDDTETTNFCMFINEVYEVLSDPVQRMLHRLQKTVPIWLPDVFAIEEDFGRARVYSQCGKPDLVQQAIDSCPVDCIHWTSAAQLSLLEDEMRRVERVNVALMLAGMGSASVDVFRTASTRWQKRQAKVLVRIDIFLSITCGLTTYIIKPLEVMN